MSGSVKAPAGWVETLERAAEIIEEGAKSLKDGHAVGGRWPKGEEATRAIYEEELGVAKRLRAGARYMGRKPMGGPANVFDACAEAIRAGASVEEAMASYGLSWSERKSDKKVTGRRAR